MNGRQKKMVIFVYNLKVRTVFLGTTKLYENNGEIVYLDSQLGGQQAPILSLLVLPPLFTIAAGLADGRLILYDLCDLIPFHVAHPPQNNSPLLKLAFMEPSDDPRACCYVWAFHVRANNQAVAVMHSLMFDRKVVNDHQDYIYKVSYRARYINTIENTISFAEFPIM